MTNLCTRSVPAGVTGVSSGSTYLPADSTIDSRLSNVLVYTNGAVKVGNQYLLQIPINGAFDAETYGISCQAFANAAVSIPSMQTSIQGLQSQMSALIAGQITQAPNAEVLQAEGVVFGVALGAAALIWGAKRLLHIFHWQSGHE